MEPSKRQLLRALPLLLAGVAASALRTPPAQAEPGAVAEDGNVEALRVVCRGLVPLSRADEAVYRDVVAVLVRMGSADPGFATYLSAAAHSLRQHFDGRWRRVSSRELRAYLDSVQQAPFFPALLSALTPTIVSLPAVWRIAGYEGESFTKGGYLLRGFNDLDWLPDPPADVMGPAA